MRFTISLILLHTCLIVAGCSSVGTSIDQEPWWSLTDQTTRHVIHDTEGDTYYIYLTPTGGYFSNRQGQRVELRQQGYDPDVEYIIARGYTSIPENGRLAGFVYVTAQGRDHEKPVAWHEALCCVTTYMPIDTRQGMVSHEQSAGSDEIHYEYAPIQWAIPGRVYTSSWFEELDTIHFDSAEEGLELKHEGGLKWKLIETSN